MSRYEKYRTPKQIQREKIGVLLQVIRVTIESFPKLLTSPRNLRNRQGGNTGLAPALPQGSSAGNWWDWGLLGCWARYPWKPPGYRRDRAVAPQSYQESRSLSSAGACSNEPQFLAEQTPRAVSGPDPPALPSWLGSTKTLR